MENKQTVEQQYEEQQMKKQQQMQTPAQQINQPENMQLQNALKNTVQAIQQSQQSIRQVQIGQGDQFQLADQRLQYALQQLQQFKAMETQMGTGLSESQKQQLEQVYHEINQAGQTLTVLQQTLSNS